MMRRTTPSEKGVNTVMIPNIKKMFPHLSDLELTRARDDQRAIGAKCEALIQQYQPTSCPDDVSELLEARLTQLARLRARAAKKERTLTLALQRRAHVARKRARGFEPTARVLRQYGLTAEAFHAMRRTQGNRCVICRILFDHTDGISIDHDHSRPVQHACGLLCHPCNRALGLFGESTATLVRAIAYLKRTRAPNEAAG
jgi:hypothetical protein